MTRSLHLFRATAIAAIVSLTAIAESAQTIDPTQPLAVRILYDNSGSMYPGYTAPGSPNRRTKAELNVEYFRRSPRFQAWLRDFISAQSLAGAGTIGMWTFTSDGAFTPGDI